MSIQKRNSMKIFSVFILLTCISCSEKMNNLSYSKYNGLGEISETVTYGKVTFKNNSRLSIKQNPVFGKIYKYEKVSKSENVLYLCYRHNDTTYLYFNGEDYTIVPKDEAQKYLR